MRRRSLIVAFVVVAFAWGPYAVAESHLIRAGWVFTGCETATGKTVLVRPGGCPDCAGSR